MRNIERNVKIRTLNNGEEFEVPERRVRHTRYVLKKLENVSEEQRGYDIGYHTVYIVLKEKFKELEYEDIDNMTDEELTKTTAIIWGADEQKVICPECKHEFVPEAVAGNFQKPKKEKNSTPKKN